MSKRTDDLRVQVEALRAELLELDTVEEPTDEQATRSTEALTEYDAKFADYEAARAHDEKIEAVRAASLNPANVERGAGFHAPSVHVKRDPFENLDAIRSGNVSQDAIRSRAIEAVESVAIRGASDEARESALRLLNPSSDEAHLIDSNAIARLSLLTGSPAYRSAFTKILAYPGSYQGMLNGEEQEALRAALSTTAANGGYAIPFLLDPTVIFTGAGSANPFRQISTIVRGVSNKWQGLTSAGVTAGLLGEGVQASDNSPTFGQPAIEAWKQAAFVFGSYEVFEDTDLASSLPGLVAQAKDDLEASLFAVGSGSSAPKGIVTALVAASGTTKVSPTTAGTFTTASVADVYKPVAGLNPRHRGRSQWVANYAVYNIIRQMSASAAGSSFWANLGANVPEVLLGRPVYEASAMDSAMTTGSKILISGDFSNFVIFDRIGATVEYIPNMVSGAGAGYPTGQRGWFTWWRSGSDTVDTGAFRYLHL